MRGYIYKGQDGRPRTAVETRLCPRCSGTGCEACRGTGEVPVGGALLNEDGSDFHIKPI